MKFQTVRKLHGRVSAQNNADKNLLGSDKAEAIRVGIMTGVKGSTICI